MEETPQQSLCYTSTIPSHILNNCTSKHRCIVSIPQQNNFCFQQTETIIEKSHPIKMQRYRSQSQRICLKNNWERWGRNRVRAKGPGHLLWCCFSYLCQKLHHKVPPMFLQWECNGSIFFNSGDHRQITFLPQIANSLREYSWFQ